VIKLIIPGFSAEASIYRRKEMFEQFARMQQSDEEEIVPQALVAKSMKYNEPWCRKWECKTWICDGSLRCRNRFCIEYFCKEYNYPAAIRLESGDIQLVDI
jgi:hypothetical protein